MTSFAHGFEIYYSEKVPVLETIKYILSLNLYKPDNFSTISTSKT